MAYVKIISTILSFVVLSSVCVSSQEKSPPVQRILNNDTVIVHFDEDVYAPEGTLLRLVFQSTKKINASESICVNRTKEPDKTALIDCWPNSPEDLGYKFTYLSLKEINGCVCLELRLRDDNVVFTWWLQNTINTPVLGTTTLTAAVMKDSGSFNVVERKDRTVALVLKLADHPYIDLALANSHHDDMYNMRVSVDGEVSRLRRSHSQTVPFHEGLWHVIIFENVTCGMSDNYTFTGTYMQDEEPKSEVTHFSLEFKEDSHVNISTIDAPQSNGDVAVLSCNVSDYFPPQWFFKGRPIQCDEQHNITTIGDSESRLTVSNFSTMNAGQYSCVINNDCNDAVNSTIGVAVPVSKQMSIDADILLSPAKYGGTAMLVCEVTGTVASIEWEYKGRFLKNNRRIVLSYNGINTLNLTIQNITQRDIGKYSCRYQNSNTRNGNTLVSNVHVRVDDDISDSTRGPPTQRPTTTDGLNTTEPACQYGRPVTDRGAAIAIIVVLPMIIILLLAVLFCLLRKNNIKQLSKDSLQSQNRGAQHQSEEMKRLTNETPPC